MIFSSKCTTQRLALGLCPNTLGTRTALPDLLVGFSGWAVGPMQGREEREEGMERPTFAKRSL